MIQGRIGEWLTDLMLRAVCECCLFDFLLDWLCDSGIDWLKVAVSVSDWLNVSYLVWQTDSVAVCQIHFKMTQHSVASCLTDSIIK